MVVCSSKKSIYRKMTIVNIIASRLNTSIINQ
jgi:hypothetical protein